MFVLSQTFDTGRAGFQTSSFRPGHYFNRFLDLPNQIGCANIVNALLDNKMEGYYCDFHIK
jgi:hypothetical protein